MSHSHPGFFDYFFILRPILFYPGWSTMLAGYFIAGRQTFNALMVSDARVNYPLLGLLMISFAMLMGSAFVLNQLRDIESDQHNKKLFFIADGVIPASHALVEVIILAVTATGLAFLVDPVIGVAYLLFFVLTGILYNYSPFRLKDRPWGSLTANALMGAITFAIGWLARYPLEMHLFLDMIPYLLFNTALYFFTTFPDMEGDRAAGKKTLAVIFGHERIITVSFVLYVTGLICVVLLKDFQAAVFYILSLPFFITTIRKRTIADCIRTTKFGILFFALSICLSWPLYLGVMVAGYFGTRLYFRKRFNLNYPNFRGG